MANSESCIDDVDHCLRDLQDRICSAFEEFEAEARFRRDELAGVGASVSRPRVLSGGDVFERAAVNYSRTEGNRLPAAATERRPELAGRDYQAVSVSLITHPANPYVPTSHMNLRFFLASKSGEAPVWWFGGGFDLTPYYGFEEDARHWHQAAKNALDPFGDQLYSIYKKACDEYFFLPHRGEPRGIGGLFFDDLSEGGFDRCLGLLRSVGEHYLEGYVPIVERRREAPFGQREREFQLYRRGRYVEFNLLHDRGTKFGLQSGGRVESILASMPPVVTWAYDWSPEPGSPEAKLYELFLHPRDWLGR